MEDDRAGSGFNRLRRSPVLTAAPFTLTIGQSRVDGRDAVILDYDVVRNPWFLRGVRDELREVSDGVFMGWSATRLGRQPLTTLGWFAVNTKSTTFE